MDCFVEKYIARDFLIQQCVYNIMPKIARITLLRWEKNGDINPKVNLPSKVAVDLTLKDTSQKLSDTQKPSQVSANDTNYYEQLSKRDHDKETEVRKRKLLYPFNIVTLAANRSVRNNPYNSAKSDYDMFLMMGLSDITYDLNDIEFHAKSGNTDELLIAIRRAQQKMFLLSGDLHRVLGKILEEKMV